MCGEKYLRVFLEMRFLGVVGGGGGVGRLLVLGGIMSVSVHNLNTHLLGQSQLNGLAGGGSQLGDALLEGLGNILNLGDGDALLGGQILAADSGQRDGLVETGLDGLGEGDIDGGPIKTCVNKPM